MHPAPTTAPATAPPQPRPIRFVTNHEGPYAKRRRVNSACLTCRRKKTRCTGVFVLRHSVVWRCADHAQVNGPSVGHARRINTSAPGTATTQARPMRPRRKGRLLAGEAPPLANLPWSSSRKLPPTRPNHTCHTNPPPPLTMSAVSRIIVRVAEMTMMVCILARSPALQKH